MRPQPPLGSLACRHPVDELGHRVGELACCAHSRMEGDRSAQVVAAHRLGETDLPSEGACVGDLGAVDGDEAATLCPVQVGGVVHAHNDDLVVGQQLPLDRLGEPEPVEHGAETGLVVHGGDLEVGLLGLLHDPAREEARGGGHEEPPFWPGWHRRRARWRSPMRHGRRSGGPRRRSPGRSRAPGPGCMPRRSLGTTDRWRTPLVEVRTPTQEGGDVLRIGRHREPEVGRTRHRRSRSRLPIHRSTPAGTRSRRRWRSTPGGFCFSSDRDGTSTSVRLAASSLSDEQRSQGLAGPARHDHLAPIG